MRRVVLCLVVLGVSGCALFAPPVPRYEVFFDERSATLSDAGRGVIAEAAAKAKAVPGASVTVAGYTDRFGSAQADVTLSRQRAEAVAAQLTADGVAANQLLAEAHGAATESNPGVESRRVEISISR